LNPLSAFARNADEKDVIGSSSSQAYITTMKLDELLPALHMLPRLDKFRAVQFLTAELAQGEAGLTPGAEYPIWSPYEAHDAAVTLTNFLKEQKQSI
jgi:hypothetical protein